MSFWVEIKRMSDGEIRRHNPGEPFNEWKLAKFIWTEGNFACDCNRYLDFQRAGGTEDPRGERCGHEAFRIRAIDADTREVIYEDYGWTK